MTNNPIKRGQIYYADLSPVVGSEQGGLRPVLIVSNDIGNKHSPVVMICPLTSQIKRPLPTHVTLTYGKVRGSTVLCEHCRTIDKSRLKNLYDSLAPTSLERIDHALKIALNLI
jgi:mRNA interferase MazF